MDENDAAAGGEGRGHRPIGELLIAIGTLALAGIAYWQSQVIPVSPLYAKVGPTVAPMLASFGLGLLGCGLLWAATRGGWQPEEERELPMDRPALLWVVAGLVANVVLIGPLGFSLSSVVMFVAIGRGFGSRRPIHDGAIAFVLASVAYYGFAQALGIDIGRGPLEDMVLGFFGRGGV